MGHGTWVKGGGESSRQTTSTALYSRQQLRRTDVREAYRSPVCRTWHQPHQGRRQQETWRVGRPVQDRQRRECSQGGWLFVCCGQGLGEGDASSRCPHGVLQDEEVVAVEEDLALCVSTIVVEYVK